MKKVLKILAACIAIPFVLLIGSLLADQIPFSRANPMGVSQIAREVKEPPSQVADDLQHLLRSLKHSDYRAAIEPAPCRACDFEFSEAKLTKPSKCPECHSTWVLEPKIGIQQRP